MALSRSRRIYADPDRNEIQVRHKSPVSGAAARSRSQFRVERSLLSGYRSLDERRQRAHRRVPGSGVGFEPAPGRGGSTSSDNTKTQHTLRTPVGSRRIDLYFAESRFAIEIKSGYVRANHEFREQVGKDVWLLENTGDLVAEVMWIFLRGATKSARYYLDARKIAWMDLDLDQMRTPVTSTLPDSK